MRADPKAKFKGTLVAAGCAAGAIWFGIFTDHVALALACALTGLFAIMLTADL